MQRALNSYPVDSGPLTLGHICLFLGIYLDIAAWEKRGRRKKAFLKIKPMEFLTMNHIILDLKLSD